MLDKLLERLERENKLNYYLPLLKKKEPKKFFISVIIPVMGRIEFLVPLVNSLNSAIKKSGNKINITIVEHSSEELFRKPCKNLNINYHWIKKEKYEPFNKSLCHNVGAILNKQSDNFLFHDLDCLVYDDFFINVINKINRNDLVFQTFKNRRLLYLSDDLTKKIIIGDISVNEIKTDDENLIMGDEGAPGGSICVNRELFINVGGFDPELFFGYSPEDLFFWNKIECFVKITSTNNEMLHMSHERLHETNDLIEFMLFCVEDFNKLDETNKLEFMNNKKNTISKFF